MTSLYTFLFIFGFVFGGGSCEEVQAQPSVGGSSLPIDAVPYQVAVLNKQALVCGGTILNQDYILTAKSCATSPVADLKIRAGSKRYSEEGTTKDISEIRPHPFADIAILKLKTSLLLNSTTMVAVKLPAEAEALDIGTKAMIAGWGAHEEGGAPNKLLQGTEVEVTDCKTPTVNTLCAGFPGGAAGACKYDVGGALVYEKKAYGVLSQYQCGKPGEPDLYTRVAAFKLWIDKNSA